MIELIVVIVILGILAATALPKFLDLSGDAKTAALKGVAGSAASAMTINYAGCAATGNRHTDPSDAAKCKLITNCSDVESLLQGGLPLGYHVEAKDLTTTNGHTDTCLMSHDDHTASQNEGQFMGISAGN